MSQCRVCLRGDIKLCSIANIELQEIYEMLANTKIKTEDRTPMTICYICYSLLQKCHGFAKTAQQAEKLQRILLTSNNMQFNLKPKLNLRKVKNLSVTVAQPEDTLHHESLQNSGDMHNNNYYCFYEEPPVVVKIEPEIKLEVISEDEEIDEVKTEENNFFEIDVGAPITKPAPIKRKPCTKKGHIAIRPSCHICKKIFHSSYHLQGHLKIHNKVEKTLCCTCGRPFSKLFNFKKHLAKCTKTNFSDNPVLTCPECNEVYTDTDEYEKHSKIHLEKRLYCSLCGKKYKTIINLNSHMRIIHTDSKPFKCDICDKSFKLRTHLKTHGITHRDDRPFECDLCAKTYPTKSSLKSHMITHTGDRPFLCNTCGVSFAFKSALNQHIRRLHVEVKAFPCNICNLSFNKEASLQGHIRSHTRKVTHYCRVCQKGFTSACNLKAHMDVHSTDRPYICNRCGKRYKRTEHLNSHLKIIKCIGVASC